MIIMLPDHSKDVESALPLSEIIMPPPICSNSVHGHQSAHQNQQRQDDASSELILKTIRNKKLFTLSNIIVGLSLLFIISVAVYFYWPQTNSQNKMAEKMNILMDISRNEAAKTITHPNDSGSGSGKASTAKTAHSRNDRPSKSTAPIPKGEGSASSKTIIGSGEPPSDDGSQDEQDPNRKKRNNLNDDSINSDLQDSSDDSEDGELLSDDDDEHINWLLPPQSQRIPFIGQSRP